MSEQLVWLAMGALSVQGGLISDTELLPLDFWLLTVVNWSCLFALPYAINAAIL